MNEPENYHIVHRPRHDGPPAHNLLQGNLIPDDIYDRPDFYSGDPSSVSFRQSVTALRRIRGKPNSQVMVYRAGPRNELNTGDWISFSKRYAKQHGMADDPSEDVPVWGFKVSAKDIIWPMDDIEEFGYFGPPMRLATPAAPQESYLAGFSEWFG